MSDRTVVLITPDETSLVVDQSGHTTVVFIDSTTVIGSDVGGPQGIPGPQGPMGETGIYVGPTPPADTTKLWVNTA